MNVVDKRRKARRATIDASKIKKVSQTRRVSNPDLRVTGERETTDYGYRVKGFACKTFETYYEVMLAGSSTDLVVHDKKSKVLRILGGTGFVILKKAEDLDSVRIHEGEEVVLKPGTPYRLATASNSSLAFLVTQETKYDSRIRQVDTGGNTVTASAADLSEPETATASRRNSSKAKEQTAVSRLKYRGNADKVPTPAKSLPNANPMGINPRPSLGKFDDSGAG